MFAVLLSLIVAAPVPTPGIEAPPDATVALEKARAAYEYGDMEMVVDAARAVAEGRVRPTPAQRVQALRYLGIGLFLTGRFEGAETAFFDLLRIKPGIRLDPTTTRPDVVAFFENVRARHADEIRQAASTQPGKRFIWNFLPPVGQFQNGHAARGWTIGAIEVLSLGATIATYAQLRAWENPNDHTFGEHTSDARTFKTLNYASAGIFGAALVVGIVDGIANFRGDRGDGETLAFITPGGVGFRF
ncbi:MAG TPA: hypothetical protein VNO55_03255 [Polyangia bacterium]|nr:hypothetical protein [Polyangia bacterium]